MRKRNKKRGKERKKLTKETFQKDDASTGKGNFVNAQSNKNFEHLF